MEFSKESSSLYIVLFGLIATPLLFFVAFINEPTYNPFLQTISKLGVTDNGQYYFIAGAVIGGLSYIIFNYYSFLDLAQQNVQIYRARIFGIISGFGLIGVGLIQDKPDLFFRFFHWLSSVIFFLFNVLFIIYFCSCLRNKILVKNFKFLYYSAFVPVIILIFYLFLSLITQEIIIGSLIFKIPVIMQKLAVFSLILWYLVLFYFIFKKELLNFLN